MNTCIAPKQKVRREATKSKTKRKHNDKNQKFVVLQICKVLSFDISIYKETARCIFFLNSRIFLFFFFLNILSYFIHKIFVVCCFKWVFVFDDEGLLLLIYNTVLYFLFFCCNCFIKLNKYFYSKYVFNRIFSYTHLMLASAFSNFI